MKVNVLLTIILGCMLFAAIACEESQTGVQPPLDEHLINSELVSTYNDMAIQNAIISQHTLYPYHFVDNSGKLNELGRRDLAVLAKHLAENPGRLNVRKDSICSELYESRVANVLDQLAQAGVDTARITVEDAMPGGAGMSSETVISILEVTEQREEYGTATSATKGVGMSRAGR